MFLPRQLTLFILPLVFFLNTPIQALEFSKHQLTQEGFYGFFYDHKEGRVFLELEELNQPFIFQSSLPHGIGSNDIGLDRGQLGDTRLVQFERAGNKIFLRQLNTRYRAISSNPLEQLSINEAFASSILWGFEINSEHQSHIIIDYTDFLLSDIHRISQYFSKEAFGDYQIDPSRSAVYPERSKAFPNNTELEAIVTYSGHSDSEYIHTVAPDSSALSVHLHHSLVKLPDDQYQARAFHPYSGFWSESYADYAQAIDKEITQRFIPRHRLKKKNPLAATSVAEQAIVYYLDPATPEPIRSALMDGATWWNQAFTAIGYQNAFQVKLLPADADPMDSRYNVIQWVHRATRGWSYGATITDPRTGEIIKGHVTLGSLRVRQDYLIALGLTSPFVAQQTDTSKQQAMALARIRQLAAHEVGHTLGIAHNFAASSNQQASVMDYPHPNIEIVNGKISIDHAYDSNIGVWDKHVIAYGYSDFSKLNEAQELAKLIKHSQAKGLRYLSDPDSRGPAAMNPYAHLWDNGENPISALEHLLQVRKIALNNLGMNSIPYSTPLSELEAVLVPIYNLHRYQVEATASLIGGSDYFYEVKTNQTARGLDPISGELQKDALNILLDTLQAETLLIPEQLQQLILPKAYGYERSVEDFHSNTGMSFDPVSAAEASAEHTLQFIFNPQRLARLQQQAAKNSNILNVGDIFNSLINKSVKQTAVTSNTTLIQQRVNLLVTQHLIQIWLQEDSVAELRSASMLALVELQQWLADHSKAKHSHQALFAHYKMLHKLISHSLEKNQALLPMNFPSLPPGSPI